MPGQPGMHFMTIDLFMPLFLLSSRVLPDSSFFSLLLLLLSLPESRLCLFFFSPSLPRRLDAVVTQCLCSAPSILGVPLAVLTTHHSDSVLPIGLNLRHREEKEDFGLPPFVDWFTPNLSFDQMMNPWASNQDRWLKFEWVRDAEPGWAELSVMILFFCWHFDTVITPCCCSAPSILGVPLAVPTPPQQRVQDKALFWMICTEIVPLRDDRDNPLERLTKLESYFVHVEELEKKTLLKLLSINA
ncbi:hypothetical protein M9H77_17443 [Catharanthus roseus]|uniref:Uncharacterized protein n=1 Tax=Catharanthus roseus TaxID=4058 RepID=A0ACC0B4L6_CATRO|nr:hypothetical protein M9H77_17443 [Catharanthus roseus]